MTQIGSRPERIALPSVESWPWQMDRVERERTRLYQPRRARPVAPTYNKATAAATDGGRPDPRGWTHQAAVPQLRQHAPPDPRPVKDPGPDLSDTDELFLPASPRSGRRPGLLRPRLPRIRLPRLRPIHVIIFTMAAVSMLMVGLALWAWLSERDRAEAVHGDDLAQIPITVITVSGATEDGAGAVEASRVSRAARSFRQRRWRRRHVRRSARRSRARRHQVDVDGLLAAGQQMGARKVDRRRRQAVEPPPAPAKAAPSKQTAVDRYLSNLKVGSY